jgi:hypothetical protein
MPSTCQPCGGKGQVCCTGQGVTACMAPLGCLDTPGGGADTWWRRLQ